MFFGKQAPPPKKNKPERNDAEIALKSHLDLACLLYWLRRVGDLRLLSPARVRVQVDTNVVGDFVTGAFLYHLSQSVVSGYGLQPSIQAEFPLWHWLPGWAALSIEETLEPILTAF
jgi:hypothetical protein